MKPWQQATILMLVCALGHTWPARAQNAQDAYGLNAEVMRLYRAGRYADAVPIAERALALREKALGSEHPDVGISLYNLASLYQALGRYREVESLYKRVLAIWEKDVGSDHPDIGRVLSDLAVLYKSQGRFSEAEPLHKRALAIRENALGPDHPDVAISLNNLGILYGAQARFSEAELLHRRALVIREKVLGGDHPDVATSLNNLASTHTSQGRFGEAEALYQRALAIRENALGRDHPDVATPLNNLAEFFSAQGRYREAELLHKRAREIWENALGSAHPQVALSLNNLAGICDAQGRFQEAEALYKRALTIRESALGADHPDVAQSLNNLAALYESQGRYGEAEPLHKRSLEVRMRAFGPNHPDVAASLNNLAGLFSAQSRFDEAEPLHKRAFAIWEDAFGPGHPLVGTAINNLASLYRAQRRFGEAEPLYQRSLALRERVFGKDHPDTATSLNNLALLYQSQGRYGEADPLYKRGLAIWESTLGHDHPSVANALNNLASLALAQRDFAGAADFWRRASAVLQRRAERGHGTTRVGSSKGEAQRYRWYFDGLVKTTQRLAAAGDRGAQTLAMRMFESAQWGVGSEAAASLAQMATRSAGGSPALAALARERQDLVAEWEAKDKQLIAFKGQPPQKRNVAVETQLGSRLAAIDKRLSDIDAAFANRFPEYAGLVSPKPSSVVAIQAALGDNEALVFLLDTDPGFKPLPEETFVWVVTKHEMRWHRSELGTDALAREVTSLRCGLDVAAWWVENSACPKLTSATYTEADHAAGKAIPFDTARAHALYKSLLGDAEDLIKGKHLLLVPSGALTTLPFQVLVTKPPNSADLASAAWLVRDHAITVLPSVASLTALRRTAKSSVATKPMIGFGNPLLDGDQKHAQLAAAYKSLASEARAQTGCAARSSKRTSSRRSHRRRATPMPQTAGLADLAHLRAQTPLPETADELCAVARGLDADVRDIRIGERATEHEVKRLSASGALANYRMIHFATHGLLAGQLSGTREPGLILTPPAAASADDDGYLSGSEIAALKLDADWVILSACNTAGGAGQGEAADALSGLARMFFYAGARALLVSHWEVDSAATVKLITSAVGELAKDGAIGRGEALRRAMVALMTDTSRPAHWVPASHPSIWAPFVVVGEGGAGR